MAGFGEDRIRSSESLSPLDAVGHGTQVASVAAGNSDVSVRMNGRTMGNFGGVAPRARIAPYKACWAAPDPADDGCATADLVSAIDRATADGVDVLNVAVAGPTSIDTVERALLGAAEADIVVVGAAGNAGRSALAGHASPVGHHGRRDPRQHPARPGLGRRAARASPAPAARAAPSVPSAWCSAPTSPPPAHVDETPASAAPAPSTPARSPTAAVLCVRGGIGRVDKSEAVAQADGVAMVLVNDRPGGVIDDFHSVPTVQLTQRDGRRLTRWARTHPRTVVRIAGVAPQPAAAAGGRLVASGDSRSTLLKPDVVALGEGVLGATPGSWALFSGTSAATARVSGLAALLRAEHDWSAPVVRSVLTTTARPLAGAPTLTQGAGQVGALRKAGLALDVPTASYRRALDDLSWRDLNASSIVMRGGGTATRRLTNLGSRAEYFSVRAVGFQRHRVRMTPVALRLAPGETATVRDHHHRPRRADPARRRLARVARRPRLRDPGPGRDHPLEPGAQASRRTDICRSPKADGVAVDQGGGLAGRQRSRDALADQHRAVGRAAVHDHEDAVGRRTELGVGLGDRHVGGGQRHQVVHLLARTGARAGGRPGPGPRPRTSRRCRR